MKKLFIIVLFNCGYYFVAAQQKESIKVTDMLQIKTANNLTITDDGSKAAFTVLSIEQDTGKWEYKYLTQVWMVATDGSQPRQLTFSKEGATQPKWRPDGKQLAFVRTVDGKPQIFLSGFDGGEAMQLTKFKYGAGNPEWSKDGKRLIFTAQIPLKDLLADTAINKNREIPSWAFSNDEKNCIHLEDYSRLFIQTSTSERCFAQETGKKD